MQPKIHISLCTSHILVQIYNLAMVYNWCPKNFLYVILLNAVVLLIITLSAHVMYLAYYGISSWCFHPFFPWLSRKDDCVFMQQCLKQWVDKSSDLCHWWKHWIILLPGESLRYPACYLLPSGQWTINNAWREDQLETQPISFILVIFFLRVM